MKARLVVQEGPLAGTTLRIPQGARLTIGRSQQADVRLDDPDLSRLHCSVEERGGRLVVVDLGSSNGTFVDGRPVRRDEMEEGALLGIGGLRLRLRFEPDTPAGALPVRNTVLPQASSGNLGTRAALSSGSTDPQGALEDPGNLRVLLALATALGERSTVSDLAVPVADAARAGCGLDRVALVLVPEGPGTWEYCSGAAGGASHTTLRIDRRAVEEVLRAGACLPVPPADGTEPLKAVCVPLPGPRGLLGVVWAESDGDFEATPPRQLAFLEAVGVLAGAAVHRARLQAGLAEAVLGTVRCLVAALEERDAYTRGHAERVTIWALALGEDLGLESAELDVLEIAGLLHDVGKIGIPEALLHKESEPTGAEWAVLRGHPEAGARIVRNLRHPSADAIEAAVRHHHEHWDGSGHPDGLAGPSIPLAARILGVCDCWDAMTSDRPYRAALDEAAARANLSAAAGSQLDPSLVQAFLARLDRRGPPGADPGPGRSRYVPTGLSRASGGSP